MQGARAWIPEYPGLFTVHRKSLFLFYSAGESMTIYPERAAEDSTSSHSGIKCGIFEVDYQISKTAVSLR